MLLSWPPLCFDIEQPCLPERKDVEVRLMTDWVRQTAWLPVFDFSRVGWRHCQRGCHAWCCAGKRNLRKKWGREHTRIHKQTHTCYMQTFHWTGASPKDLQRKHMHKMTITQTHRHTRIPVGTKLQSKLLCKGSVTLTTYANKLQSLHGMWQMPSFPAHILFPDWTSTHLFTQSSSVATDEHWRDFSCVCDLCFYL